MFCPKCGQPYTEGTRFCAHCGTPLQQEGPATHAPQPGTPPQAFSTGVACADPVMNLLRRLATSPLYLTGAIAYSCMILFQLISPIFSNSMGGAMDQYLGLLLRYGNMGMGELAEVMDQLEWISPMLQGASLGSALVGQLPNILIAAGIWLVFASAMDRSGQPLKTSGLTLIKVIVIIQTVLIGLLALIVVVGLFILMAALANYEDSVVPFFLVMIAIFAVVFALAILFYAKLIGTVSTMQNSIRTGVPSDRVSAYVAVLAILGGIGSILGLFGTNGLIAVLATVAEIVAAFAFGIFLFKYRDAMRMAMAGHFSQEAVSQPSSYGRPEPAYQEPQPVYSNPESAYQEPQPVYSNPEPAHQESQPVYSNPEPVYQEPQPTYSDSEPVVQARATTPIPSPSPFVPETTVLNAAVKQPDLQITRMRDGSHVQIAQPRFRIGRDPAVVDYIINDNTAVGRQHADILIHDGACYVVDLNSTNHTYLNGQPLNPGTEYPLQDGDDLLLGDEAFRVKLS